MANFKNTFLIKKEKINDENYTVITLSEEVSFLNKAAVKLELNKLKENSNVIIDATKTVYIDPDVIEIIDDFKNIQTKDKNINLILKGFKNEYGLKNTHREYFSKF